MLTRELHAAAILWIQRNIEHSFPNWATPTEVAEMLDQYAEEEQIPIERVIEQIQEHHQDGAPEPAERSEDELKLGKCCACEREDATVRSVVMLEYKSPEPGDGCWGCFQCGLPMAGAVAVLCDACLTGRKPLRFACLGTPADNRRVPIEQLAERFEHDLAKHPEELALRDLAPRA